MKKIVLVIMFIFTMFLLIGCSNKEYTLTLLLEDGSTYEVVTYSDGELNLNTPTKEGYDFIGWFNSEDVNVKDLEITNDVTLYAKFNAKTFSCKFIVEGVTVKEEVLKYGDEIIFPDDPSKKSTDGKDFVFIGWDKEDKVIKENIEFNAVFSEVDKEYTYKFIVDGEVIKEIKAVYNSEIVYPETPTKQETDEYGYIFSGWDNNAEVLLKDEVFNGSFAEVKKYTYIFTDDEGTTIKEETALEGSEIIYPENPVKESTDMYDFTFVGWDCEDKILTEDLFFEAIFESTLRKYTCKFVDYDGTVLQEELIEYGKLPVAPENPTRDNNGEFEYIFKGWDKRITDVTGDVIYIAEYEEVKSVKFESLDNKVISILGDSISTFYSPESEVNSYYTEKDTYYYPTYSSTIKNVEKTWWYQLYNKTNMKLGINNSWSGTCAEESGDRAGYSDARINTLDDNGTPDIVIVYLGTNDNASGVGSVMYKNAINKIINKIRDMSNAQIYLVTLGYSSYSGMSYKETTRIQYNEVLRQIAEERKCGIIPLDEYVVEENYSVYLGDFLHYNAKGAELLSKVSEKAIKEYNGLEYNEKIEIEYPEKLPEGTLGKVQATAKSGFWDNDGYLNNVYFNEASSSDVATFSLSIEITKNADNGKYYVTEINQSGVKASYNCDYVLLISELNTNYGTYVSNLKDVVVGSIVEFDLSKDYPLDILFIKGDGNSPSGGDEGNQEEIIEGQLHIGAYNAGIWTLYNDTVMAYEYSKIDQASTYINFYIIKLVKESDNTYSIVGLKNIDVKAEFPQCDIYIMIYRDLEAKTYFENAKIGGKVTVTGDITSGNCNLKFE